MTSDRNQPIYRRPRALTPQRKAQIQPKKAQHTADHHDAYLRAACASRVPLSVSFLDGEVIERATIRQVHMFTLLLEVGKEDVLVYNNALKKISSIAE